MKVALVYLHVVGLNEGYDPSTEELSGSFDYCAERFMSTYRLFNPGYPHDLYAVFANGSPKNLSIYDNIPLRMLHYEGTGWCSGAHQYAARHMNADFAVFCSARTHFWKPSWLRRLVEAREKFGHGMYGTMSSSEGVPHLRTNCYCLDPEVLRCFEHPLDSRPASRTLESGEWNLSANFASNGFASMLVTWDGVYTRKDWRRAENIFRRGTQENCLVWDRHTAIYALADETQKRALERTTDPE